MEYIFLQKVYVVNKMNQKIHEMFPLRILRNEVDIKVDIFIMGHGAAAALGTVFVLLKGRVSNLF